MKRPSMRELKAIYSDPKRTKDFKRGVVYGLACAADFLETWEGSAARHRMADLLLWKFNVTSRKPRLKKEPKCHK